MNRKTNRKTFIPVALSVLLAACGGSGGGDGPVVSPDLTLAITSNNAMQVARVAYDSATASQGFADADGGFFFLGAAGGISKSNDGIEATGKAGDGGAGDNGGSFVPIPSETIDCFVSGTQTISGELADPVTPTLTAGDYFQYEYAACNDGLGVETNGTTRMDVDAFSGDLLSEAFSMTLTLTLTNLQETLFEGQSTTPTDVVNSHGAVTVSLDVTQQPFFSTGISGNSMTVSNNAGSDSLTNFATNFTVDTGLFPSPYTTSSSGTLDSTQLAGVVRFSNPVQFEGLGSDYPNSGEFLVEGLDSRLRLIAVNNIDVRIEIDLGADNTVDDTIVTTWAELAAL